MKRNTKIKLLIAGSAVLSASILIPTTLASCTSQDNSANNQALIDQLDQTKEELDKTKQDVTNLNQQLKDLNQAILSSEKARIENYTTGLKVPVNKETDLDNKDTLDKLLLDSIGGTLSVIQYSLNQIDGKAPSVDKTKQEITFYMDLTIGKDANAISVSTNKLTITYVLPKEPGLTPEQVQQQVNQKLLEAEEQRLISLKTLNLNIGSITQQKITELTGSGKAELLNYIGGHNTSIHYTVENPVNSESAKTITFNVKLEISGSQSKTVSGIVVHYDLAGNQPQPPAPTPGELATQQNVNTLNDNNNGSYRKMVYGEFIKDLNSPAAAPKSRTVDNSGIGLPVKPEYQGSGITTKMDALVKNPAFIDQLINMIKNGLVVGTGANEISQDQLNALVTEMTGLKSEIATPAATYGAAQNSGSEPKPDPKGTSTWSSNAFAFRDDIVGSNQQEIPTWTFAKKAPAANGVQRSKASIASDIEYKLYLTSDVDFKYEVKSDKTVGVTVTNGDSANVAGNKKVRLEVKSPVFGSNANAVKTFYFKTVKDNSGNSSKYEFDLPTMLFADFNNFFNSYESNTKTYQEYLTSGTTVYNDLAKSGITSSATLWNQFALTNNDKIKEAIELDLNTNKQNASLIQWLRDNLNKATQFNDPGQVPNTTVLEDLEKELSEIDGNTKTAQLSVTPLMIEGASGAIHEDPMISIWFGEKGVGGSKVSAGAKKDLIFFLDLYPTEFKFTPTSNKDFGFKEGILTTQPTLTFDNNSKLSSFEIPAADSASHDLILQKSALLNVNANGIDVSRIYDINNSGFSSYLVDLLNQDVNNKNTQITNKLLAMHKPNSGNDFVTSFTNYLAQNGNKLLEDTSALDSISVLPELRDHGGLSDFIMDNIDLTNMANYVNKGSSYNNGIPSANDANAWRTALSAWIMTKAKISIMTTEVNGLGVKGAIKIEPKSEAELLTIPKGAQDSTAPEMVNQFSNIFIYFGASKEAVNNVIADAAWVKKEKGYVANARLSLNTKLGAITKDGENSTEAFQTAIKNKACVVFQKADLSSTGPQKLNNGPAYAFYMGQKKSSATNYATETQTLFPVTIPKCIVSTDAFITEMTGVTKPGAAVRSQKELTIMSTITTPIVMQQNSSWSVKR